MKRSSWIPTLTVFVTALPLAALAAAPASRHGELGKFIPADVWLYAAGSNTADRAFLNAHWARVWNKAKESGLGTEIRNVLEPNMTAEDKAKFNELWKTASDLCAKVNWGDLVGGDVVFAQRSEGLMPDMFMLFRPKAETRDANVEGLAAIFVSLSQMTDEFRFTWTQLDGAKLWSLEANTAPIGLYLLHQDEVVGLFIGKQAMEDTRALLSGGGAKTSIVADPRFLEAAKKVPASDFSTTYMDLDRFFKYLGSLPDAMTAGGADDESVKTLRNVLKHMVSSCDIFDYGIHTGRMDGLREFYTGYTQLKPGCESKPLYKFFGSQKRLDNVCQYVPQDAVAYSATSGVNFNEMYKALEDMIKNQVPDGATEWSKWVAVQRDGGFDLQDDVLSWMSGEFVSVTLPAAIQSPFGGADEVSMLRVNDPEKARTKINQLIDRLNTALTAHEQALMIQPAQQVPVEGFRTVTHPMMAMFLRPCVGVWDEWLVIGTSEAAIVAVMETKSGKRPDFRENPRFKKEGIVPEGQVCSASFTDLSNMGQEFAAAAGMMSFAFGMAVPDRPETRGLKAMMGLIGKLTPAIMEINFFSSMSAVSTFDGKSWKTTYVTNYKDVPTGPATASNP